MITASHYFSHSAQLIGGKIFSLERNGLTNTAAFTLITFSRNMPTQLLRSKR